MYLRDEFKNKIMIKSTNQKALFAFIKDMKGLYNPYLNPIKTFGKTLNNTKDKNIFKKIKFKKEIKDK